MEEIWKDIPNLSSRQNPNNGTFDPMNLQEFLARPFLNPNYNVLNPIFQANLCPAAGHASPVINNNHVLMLRPPGNSMTSTQQQQQQQQSSSSARKRIAIPYENDHDQNNSASRRYLRLIKNRESAARSRDRKEAHTADLEVQLKTLRAENAMLIKEQKSRVAAAAHGSKKHTLKLNRTLSSPI